MLPWENTDYWQREVILLNRVSIQPSDGFKQVSAACRSYEDTIEGEQRKKKSLIKKKALLYIEVLTTHTPPYPTSFFHPPPCLSFTVSSFLHRFLVSARLLHPDQSGILSRLLWSLHHNYGAVGTGEIRDGWMGVWGWGG